MLSTILTGIPRGHQYANEGRVDVFLTALKVVVLGVPGSGRGVSAKWTS